MRASGEMTEYDWKKPKETLKMSLVWTLGRRQHRIMSLLFS